MSFELEPGTFDALIFDCDGTLVETLPAHVAGLQATLAGTGVKPSAAWMRTKYGQSPATVLLAVERELGPIGLPHEDVLRDWSANYGRNLQRLEEIEAVSGIARAWRGRVPMAVASNGHRTTVVATLEAVGLSGLFDTVVAIEDVRKGKPAPDLFLEAARRMRVRPERCVVFEDSEEGMAAARSAGMHVVYAPGLSHG
jgi:beta-phosphoglucomutase-like phosphatase (HAD superfamily)